MIGRKIRIIPRCQSAVQVMRKTNHALIPIHDGARETRLGTAEQAAKDQIEAQVNEGENFEPEARFTCLPRQPPKIWRTQRVAVAKESQ